MYYLNHMLNCSNAYIQAKPSFELINGFVRLSCEMIRQLCKIADWDPLAVLHVSSTKAPPICK